MARRVPSCVGFGKIRASSIATLANAGVAAVTTSAAIRRLKAFYKTGNVPR
jgi:hypothetical protein